MNKILSSILLYLFIYTQICPRETICADSIASMIYLTIARCSAWFDYPLYMVLFLSKCDNLNNLMQRTSLRVWLNFSEVMSIVLFFTFTLQSIYIIHFLTSSNLYYDLLFTNMKVPSLPYSIRYNCGY